MIGEAVFDCYSAVHQILGSSSGITIFYKISAALSIFIRFCRDNARAFPKSSFARCFPGTSTQRENGSRTLYLSNCALAASRDKVVPLLNNDGFNLSKIQLHHHSDTSLSPVGYFKLNAAPRTTSYF